MGHYQHILATIDLGQNKLKPLETALNLSKIFNAQLTLVHIVIHRLYNSYGFLGDIDIEETIFNEARKKMDEIAEQFQIPQDHQILKIGLPQADILDIAQEKKIDLIVAGTHHHHILGMLGSTANFIANHANCDVLLVQDEKIIE